MRVAVLGQGSIGRRHAANALTLGHEVSVYDPAPAEPPPGGAVRRTSLQDCLADAEAAVVASPSSEHAAQARTAIELGVPTLVEKPLALDTARAAELDWLARERGVLLSVAMNLREHSGAQALKSLLAEGTPGRVAHARAWCGSWLPLWHVFEDYRRSYSARRELGGGVLLDVAVHELDCLLWLLGPARTVSALARRVSDLEIDVEDVAAIALELESGAVAEVSVDYLDHDYHRGCRIVGAKRTLSWSWDHLYVGVYENEDEVLCIPIPNDIDETYATELERFLAAVKSGAGAPVPASEAAHVLAVIDAARTSSQEGRRVTVAPPPTLRAAGEDDFERLLAWRNDPDTRRFSRDSQTVTREEHARWLAATLADRGTRLWIAESDGAAIGQVRVGPHSEGLAEVHVGLAPQARGRALGSAVLVQAAARALADADVKRLCAHVKHENAASLRAFARAGFQAADTAADGLVRLERHRVG